MSSGRCIIDEAGAVPLNQTVEAIKKITLSELSMLTEVVKGYSIFFKV